jgi:multidrug efflux system membrane fusion protein
MAAGALLAVVGTVSACSASKSGAAVEPRGARPVPVLPATVVRRDVPVFLEGIGSVVAYKTVTVRSQVDGRLIQVLFREGQAVRKGEVLAKSHRETRHRTGGQEAHLSAAARFRSGGCRSD